MMDAAMGTPGRSNWLTTKLRNARNKLQRRAVFAEADVEARFTKTYKLNYWGDAESRSGSGSTMAYTAGVRAALPQLVKDYAIRSMFDAPCGDWNWMRTLRPYLPLDYIGGDIVRPLIVENEQSYGSDHTRFVHLDLIRDPFPKVDLWFCRDCLFHLSYADATAAMRNFLRAGIPYALLTTHKPGAFDNRDIVTGDFRPIDMMAAPYNLPATPLARFDDYLAPDIGREMCLWSREQIAEALGVPLNP